jgi:transcriptional regulatory protein LevR
MVFNERLDILVTGNVISQDVERAVRRVIRRFRDHWRIELTEENGGRMVTHLAMALMRISQNKEVNPLEQEQYDEFRSSEYFPRAVEITDDLCGWTPLELPESERQYLIINICLILDDINEG